MLRCMLKKTSLLLLIALQIFVAGCWDRRELNELAIAVGIGIDRSGDEYKVSVQVVAPGEVTGQKGGGNKTPVMMFEATGQSLFEALRRMTTISPRKIYMSHLRILVFGESMAREGIGDVLDFISRDHETRTDFYIIVARETTAKETLKVLTPLEAIPANKLFSTLKTSEANWAPTTTVTLDKIISELTSVGKHPVLTGLRVIGQEEIGDSNKNIEKIDSPAKLIYSGLAVFNADKLIGWLNEDESATYTFIRNKLKSTVGTVKCPDGKGKVSFDVIRSKTKIHTDVIDEKPKVNIEIRMELNVAEVHCALDLTKRKTIFELEELLNRRIEEYVESNIENVQKNFGIDIFGFGEFIHRSNPDTWKKLSENWDDSFSNMHVNVKSTSKIRGLGTVSNPYLEQKEKLKMKQN